MNLMHLIGGLFKIKCFNKMIEQIKDKFNNGKESNCSALCYVPRVMSSLSANTSISQVTHIVVVLPAPLCPRKETTWFSWRLRLSLSSASLLPVLYTLVSLSMHTTSGRWLGSSSMPRISSAIHRQESLAKYFKIMSAILILCLPFFFNGTVSGKEQQSQPHI